MVNQAQLGDVAQFINGAAFKPEDWGNEGLRIIRIQNLTDETKPYNLTTRKVDEKLVVKKGDLLVSWSATLGVFEWKLEEYGLLNQHIFRVIPNIKVIDKQYLKHVLVSALCDMNKHLHGATMKHVNRGEFLATKIPLPPLAEQQRIAAILDKAEEIKRKREQAIVKLDELAQSTFIEMFGDPSINPKKWKISRLAYLCIDIADIDHKMPKAVDEGYPFISAKDLVKNKISFEDVKKISPSDFFHLSRKIKPSRGDIIYSRIGVNLGKARIVEVDFDFVASYSCCTIKPNTSLVDPYYLCNLLDSPSTLKQAHKGVRAIAVPDLGMGEIRNFEVILPPLDLQKKFSNAIKHQKNKLNDVEISLNKINRLIASLQHQAFTTGFNE